MSSRVVITGIGIRSAIGSSLQQLDAFVEHPHTGLKASEMVMRQGRTRVVLTAPAPDLPSDVQHGDRRTDRSIRLALATTGEALAQAGLELDALHALGPKAEVAVGSGIGCYASVESSLQQWTLGLGAGPLAILTGMHNAVAARLAISHRISGVANTFAMACASSAQAIAHLAERIQSRAVTVGLACGVDLPLAPSMLEAWVAMRVYASVDPGSAPCWRRAIPFDQNRSGLTLGEACVTLVLEDLDHALHAGRLPLAELVAWGATTDAADMLKPSSGPQVACMQMALHRAGVSFDRVGYVNAHATGTRIGDAVEAASLRELFPHRPWVSSTKASHGHTLGAAGALELAVAVSGLRRLKAPPTYGLTQLDDGVRDDSLIGGCTPQALDPDALVMSNSFAFGGHNVSLLLRRAR